MAGAHAEGLRESLLPNLANISEAACWLHSDGPAYCLDSNAAKSGAAGEALCHPSQSAGGRQSARVASKSLPNTQPCI